MHIVGNNLTNSAKLGLYSKTNIMLSCVHDYRHKVVQVFAAISIYASRLCITSIA